PTRRASGRVEKLEPPVATRSRVNTINRSNECLPNLHRPESAIPCSRTQHVLTRSNAFVQCNTHNLTNKERLEYVCFVAAAVAATTTAADEIDEVFT
ncbi:hypothetical protein LSAT2_004617, partial [Lamellibrachia satsuma]